MAAAIALTLFAPPPARAKGLAERTTISIEGKLLRAVPKGKRCKFEINVSSASITDGAVAARLVLEQPCSVTKDATPKVGTTVTGTIGATRVRKNVRTSKDGSKVLEFSARVHGSFVDGKLTEASTARPNGRLIGDQSLGSAKK